MTKEELVEAICLATYATGPEDVTKILDAYCQVTGLNIYKIAEVFSANQ